MKGKVKFFNEMKGFGFITGDDGKDYFVHQTGVKNAAVITDNDQVEFDVEQGDRGPKATNVVKDSGESQPADDAPEENASEDESGQDDEQE